MKKRIFCPNCNNIIVYNDKDLVSLLENKKDRNNNFILTFFIICNKCKKYIKIKEGVYPNNSVDRVIDF